MNVRVAWEKRSTVRVREEVLGEDEHVICGGISGCVYSILEKCSGDGAVVEGKS